MRRPRLTTASAPDVPTAPVPPRRVAVVGAGMAGLCTALFLQEQGIAVTVLELGPVTGRLLAGLVTGRPAPELRPFDPLR